MDGLGLMLYWSALTVAAVAILIPTAGAVFVAEAAVLLVAGPVLLAMAPTLAPWLAVPVVLLLFAPGFIGLAVNARIGAERYRQAQGLAVIQAMLHPVPGTFALARYCRAMALLQENREARALSMLRGVASGRATIGLSAALTLCTRREEAEPLLDDPRLDEPTGSYRLRVLGSAGRTEAMIDLYRGLLGRRPALPMVQESVRALIVLMYAGRPRGVDALETRVRRATSPAARAIHRAYAELASGEADRERALAVLRGQAASGDGFVRRRAALYLADPPAPAAALAPERAAFLDRLETAVEALPASRPWWRAPMTLALIALNLAAFVVEAAAGGTTDSYTLYRLGALPTVDLAWPDDAWRLVTEMFLHSGPIHVGANMLTLLVLGSVVERMLGPGRFLLLYLGSGLAANVGTVLLASAGLLRPELIVGASGAIMGLVGGVTGSALRHVVTGRSPLFARRLLLILAFVALQFAIDATIPRVSSTTHILGAGAGLMLGLVLPFRWPAPAASFAESVEPAGESDTAAPAPARRARWRSLAAPLAIFSVATSLAIAWSYR